MSPDQTDQRQTTPARHTEVDPLGENRSRPEPLNDDITFPQLITSALDEVFGALE